MSNTNVALHVEGPQATITFNSEKGINVLSTEVMKSLKDVVGEVLTDTAIRTTVFRADGKVFIAGANIKEMVDYNADKAREYGLLGESVFDNIAALPSITVAAISGAALGGGLELALACDFRIAFREATLGLPEVTLGLIPGWGGIRRLTSLVGPAAAKRLFLGGGTIGAEEGFRLGLIDETVHAATDLTPRVNDFCKRFVKAAPTAVALAKRAARDGDALGAFADCFTTADSHEGMSAFLERRKASWMGE